MEYIRVDEAPETLKDNEMVVTKPEFLEEIAATRARRGIKSVVTIRNLRDTLMLITDKYDNTINPYRLNLQNYNNLVYDGDKEYSKIVLKVIKDNDLTLLDKAVEKQLLTRKPVVDTVYYVSDDLDGSTAFISLGFNMKVGKKASKKTVK